MKGPVGAWLLVFFLQLKENEIKGMSKYVLIAYTY